MKPEIPKSIFGLGEPGRRAVSIGQTDVPGNYSLPPEMLRQDLDLPEVGQLELVRYFNKLAKLNYGIENGDGYPLGSCSMKYNPKINEETARIVAFLMAHPHQDYRSVQGSLKLMYELQGFLAEITGMDATTLSPLAGAHGEFTGILVIKKFHQSNNEDQIRRKIIVPESAHGTNSATAAMAGYEVGSVGANAEGDVDLDELTKLIGRDSAAMMITQPSTLGLFERNFQQIAGMLHDVGAQVYVDGANMNALLGQVRPGDLDADVMHMNLHKTTSTPHGGGGPGSGPVMVKEYLKSYLPNPIVILDDDGCYKFKRPERSIGRVGGFFGNFGILLRAYGYIRSLGPDGLRAISENAVVNANYLKVCLEDDFDLAYSRRPMHEVVFQGTRQKKLGVRTLDIAKRLIDKGFHPPTIYFPLIAAEALMFEPTESETKASIDELVEAMREIAREAQENPQVILEAPHNTPVGRLNEAQAARNPDLRWKRKV